MGLKQDKLDELVASLYQVSDPAHHRYGQHLSKEEVAALVAPHPKTVDIVNEWLTHHGVDTAAVDRTGGGEWITMTVTVEQAERMLGQSSLTHADLPWVSCSQYLPDTKYEIFDHEASAESIIRTLGYNLPSALHEHIDVVSPTTYFGTFRSMRATSFLQPNVKPAEPDFGVLATPALAAPGPLATVPASCSSTITPACLRALYNTTTYTPTVKRGYIRKWPYADGLHLSRPPRTSSGLRATSRSMPTMPTCRHVPSYTSLAFY